MNTYTYAKPTEFLNFTRYLLPGGGVVALACFAIGFYFALFNSPPDYQQGETVRIMYVHVPASWMALGIYSFMALMSTIHLIWKHQLPGVLAKSAAPIGACFTLICLITGAIWGKPMWGAWWVWDARLTSVLILFFLYIGYIVLVDSFDEPMQGLYSGSILALIGFVNVPIIKFSVDWWSTLHQPASVMKLSQPSIHASMLLPLLVMAAAYCACFIFILSIRVRSELLAYKLRSLQIRLIYGELKK